MNSRTFRTRISMLMYSIISITPTSLFAQSVLHSNTENSKLFFSYLERDTTIAGVFKEQYIKEGKLIINKDTFRSRLFELGNSLISEGNYNECIQLYKSIEPFLPLWKGTKREIHVFSVHYNNIGVGYFNLGDYEQAIAYYLKSLSISEKGKATENILMQCRTLANLGDAFYDLGDTAKARYYYVSAYRIASRKKFLPVLAAVAIYRGNTERENGNLDQALIYYKDALKTAGQARLLDSWKITIVQTAYTYLLKNEPRKALQCINSKPPLGMTKTNPIYEDVAILSILGDTYFALKNYSASEKSYSKALVNAQKLGSKATIYGSYEKLSILYAEQGSYHQAYNYLKKHTDLFKKTLNENKLKEINKLEVKYRTAQKDKEIAEKQMQLKDRDQRLERKNTLIGIISSGALVLILITFLIIRNFKNKQRLQMSERENIRLKALMNGEEKERNRIARDLHDGIGGLLSAAKMSFSSVHPPNNIPVPHYTKGIQLLDEAYKELRQTAHNLSPEILKNKGLLEASRIFCEKIAHNKNLDINFQSFGKLPYLGKETELSLYRILQELMQNIVKHAKATQAVVQISVEGDDLNIVVEDNGSGIMEHKKENGIGMNNLKSRVEALHGKIDIDSRIHEGTTIYLEFSILSLQNIA